MSGMHETARSLLRTTLADCTHFRNWGGHGWDQSQALDRIYYGGLPRPNAGKKAYTLPELRDLRPYVFVYTEPEGGAVWSETAVELWQGSGVLWLAFERDVDDGVDEDEDIGVLEQAIVQEVDRMVWSDVADDDTLTKLARQAGYLSIQGPIVGYGPFRSDIPERKSYGDVIRYELSIPWGFGA